MKPVIFKTANAFGKYMIYKISFLGIGGIYGLYYFTKDVLNKQPEENLPYFIMIMGFFFLIFILLKFVPGWFIEYCTVELYEDRIVGYTLFGKRGEIAFDSIKEIKKADKIYDGGMGLMLIDEFNNDHRINGGLDYAGFLHDYIVEKCKNTAKIDYNFIYKIKANPYRWAYTRRTPFDTKYEKGYLEWLEPIVNAQKEMLIQRGELRGDVLYGDDVKDLAWTKKER